MSRPSVGRIVHYHNPNNDEGRPYGAIITAVPAEVPGNPTSEVTLTVFTPNGGRFATTVSENQTTPDIKEWWEWPPRVE